MINASSSSLFKSVPACNSSSYSPHPYRLYMHVHVHATSTYMPSLAYTDTLTLSSLGQALCTEHTESLSQARRSIQLDGAGIPISPTNP